MQKEKEKKIMTKKKIDWRIVCFGIICLTALEICAMLKGINGALLTLVIAIIAVAVGISIENPFKIK